MTMDGAASHNMYCSPAVQCLPQANMNILRANSPKGCQGFRLWDASSFPGSISIPPPTCLSLQKALERLPGDHVPAARHLHVEVVLCQHLLRPMPPSKRLKSLAKAPADPCLPRGGERGGGTSGNVIYIFVADTTTCKGCMVHTYVINIKLHGGAPMGRGV